MEKDYKSLAEEQAKALNILAKRCKEKERTIELQNREIKKLKNKDYYKELDKEQREKIKTLAKNCRKKDREILKLNCEIRHLNAVIKKNKIGEENEKECN